MSRGKSISIKEAEFIKVHLLDMSIGDIAAALGRNYWTIYKYAQKAGVSKNHNFTPAEDNFIRRNYTKFPVDYIASKIGVPVSSIYNRARILKISKYK